jgi:maltooligosyltrehalose trehalohydrolase
MTFNVWAPLATRLELDLGGRRIPMEKTTLGWWRVEADAAPETDYGFVIDGRDPVLPDPRSPWQPQGVHGRSRVVDHAAFRWTDGGFAPPPLEAAVIYELHVGTFTPEGTFEGAITRLQHLADLGVTHVELLPVAQFPGARGWGYDGVHLFAPHSAYGGPEGLKRLVDACHAQGLAVVLDVVYNHLGPAGNYLGRYAPYFTDRHKTPWGQAVNLDDAGSDEVRRFVCDNALQWLREYHVDALRLDAVHALFDQSAVHLLEQLADEVGALARETGRTLALIAESDLNDPRIVRPKELGGYGIDAQWSDDFHHALHALLTGERQGYYADFGRVADLAQAIERVFVYDGRYAPSRGRVHGRPVGDVPRHRFLAYLQNHDQVGNRAQGDRTAHLLGPEDLRIAAALVLLSPFVPLLFQGEEWGATSPFPYFTDHEDPELADAVREGRRREFAAFGWAPESIPDPQATDTFERARLAWEERERAPHAGLLDWHRRLIGLRRALRGTAAHARYDEAARWLVLERGGVAVACNLAPHEQAIPFGAHPARHVLLASGRCTIGSDAIALPHGVAVLGDRS